MVVSFTGVSSVTELTDGPLDGGLTGLSEQETIKSAMSKIKMYFMLLRSDFIDFDVL